MNNLLYPRLDPDTAHTLREHLRVSDPNKVTLDKDVLEGAYLSPKAFPPSGGTGITIEQLLLLRTKCIASVEEAHENNDTNLFDKNIGREFWRASVESTGEFGTPQVWDFLTLILLPDLAVWRFPPTTTDFRLRMTGGNRRHIFQRLWRRWNVFGNEAVESDFLLEDDYANILERRLSGGTPEIARRVYREIQTSGLSGDSRRQFTRTFMRQLVQVSGIVHVSHADDAYLDEVFEQVRHRTHDLLK